MFHRSDSRRPLRNIPCLACAILCASVFVSRGNAQAPARPRYVLMCLAAHPDDEDGATLAYYNARYAAKTYTVFFTRGEGGQNEIGPELYKSLAIIRTSETEKASALVGSAPFFLNFPDFGYSKTATETYRQWGGEDEALRRLVYIIRLLKPDVVITNHHVWPDGGENHGNHQAVALAALEAFAAAADTAYHPEQFADPRITPWQVKKLFFRVWDYETEMQKHFAKPSGYSSLPDVYVPVGEYDAQRGARYIEIANDALRQHRTQGMQFLQPAVVPNARIWYKLMQADNNYPAAPDNVFSGITPTARPAWGKTALPATFTSLDYLNAEQPARGAYPRAAVAPEVSVGIIQTYDSTFAESLNLLHVPCTLLDSSMLAASDLSRFSTIIVDIRGYGKRPDLVQYNARLLDYVHAGGNVIVFYQKTFDWKPDFAPYPLRITRDRVTNEDAPVTTLLPANRIFHSPNEIADDDWNGWVVERGLYYPAPANHYAALLSMSDPGEPPLKTGLLLAQYGGGTYWYCCLSLYRQLQLWNAGAFKLFANLISYNLR